MILNSSTLWHRKAEQRCSTAVLKLFDQKQRLLKKYFIKHKSFKLLVVSPPVRDKGVFRSIVEVAFQNVFPLEMHQNNIFYFFFKFIYDTSTSKRSKNTKKTNLKLNKIQILTKSRFNLNSKRALSHGTWSASEQKVTAHYC
jgi:hypothetical protein